MIAVSDRAFMHRAASFSCPWAMKEQTPSASFPSRAFLCPKNTGALCVGAGSYSAASAGGMPTPGNVEPALPRPFRFDSARLGKTAGDGHEEAAVEALTRAPKRARVST